MIKSTDPNHSEYINKIDDDKDYEVLTHKLKDGESIQCAEDKDMVITKESDTVVILQKKSFSKNCFIQS
jgi:hypothetical protein